MKYLEVKLEENRSILVDESYNVKEGEIGHFYDFDYNKITKVARDVNGDRYYPNRNIKRITASINHSISLDVPVVIIEDKVVNFNKAEIHHRCYSEADLRKAIGLSNHVKPHHILGEVFMYTTDEIINSLKRECTELDTERRTALMSVDVAEKGNWIKLKNHSNTFERLKTHRDKSGQLIAIIKKH